MAKIPVLRPQIPRLPLVENYLRQMDDSRWYSNWGPLLSEFERRLALAGGLDVENVVVVANATLGLSMALRALIGDARGEERNVAVPNWTFAATPGAVSANGWTPVFVDIDPNNFEMSQSKLLELKSRRNLSAAIPVAIYGAPSDLMNWEKLSNSNQLPLVYDFAASMDLFLSGHFKSQLSRNPIVFSLHATKTFGIGEGCLIVSKDRELISSIKRLCNFGFWGTREALVAGTNAKLSEIHAAYGLAALDEWPEKRRCWFKARSSYQEAFGKDEHFRLMPAEDESWISSYMHVIADSQEHASGLETYLGSVGVETRRWWGFGMNKHPAYKTDELFPVCDDVSKRVIGLPCFTDLSNAQIEFVCNSIREFSATLGSTPRG